MHKKAIIYCRKSTDRDDKQQNSLESQMNACMRTIEKNQLILIDSFIESASAKKSGKRPIFETLLSLCKKGKVDYIVVDEASRLSRNNTDSAKILWLLEEEHIKGIYTTSQRYVWEQASELFMLLLNFGMAKLDNDTRARNIKSRMITCAEKWRCLWKAPFGYKNITILKDGQVSRKGVLRDPLTAPIVEHIFRMRGEEKKSIVDISSYFQKEYGTTMKHKFSFQWIDKMLKNKFYIGMIHYSGKIYTGEHEGIISTSLFEKVQKLERSFYNNEKSEEKREASKNYLYKWMIRDSEWIYLTADVKKEKYIYYRNQNLRSSCRINISQNIIEQEVTEKLKEYIFPSHLYKMWLALWKELIEERNKNLISMENELEKEIKTLKEKENRLLSGYLEEVIDSEIYKRTSYDISEKTTLLEARKKEIKRWKVDDLEKKLREMFELLENLSERYKLGNSEFKTDIHRKLEFELFINTKKELTVEDSKLFSALKRLNLNDGTDTENRTPITGMRILCPNR